MTSTADVCQTTIGTRVTIEGIGVHTGKPVTMALCPADADTGVTFVRQLNDGGEVEIPALSHAVGSTTLCTVLGDPNGVFVATVEHLLAALTGLGIDNVMIEIDGSEVPVMDGSAADYVDAIDEAGVVRLRERRRVIRIDRPVRVENGDSFAEFTPHAGRRFELEVVYDNEAIGRQAYAVDLDARNFRRDISRARTFGFMKDVEHLRSAGFALGSSLENSVVIGEDGVVNPDGLRYRDEFVRHKLLDALGDLALAGMPIWGRYRSFKGGHALNSKALQALLAQPDSWSVVSLEGAAPKTKRLGRPVPVSMPAPAFGPDVT